MLPMNVGRATAVVEIVAALAAHIFVLNSTKIDPDMRELMCEERSRIQKFLVVDLSRLVGGGPLRIAFDRQRMRRRAQAQQVDQQPSL